MPGDFEKAMVRVENASKTFVMHLQGGTRLPAVAHARFTAVRGECLVLAGPSGIGKSSLLKMIYGNYRCDSGAIHVHHQGRYIDVAQASARMILRLRLETVGYVSQFLRVMPRVSAFDVVCASAKAQGMNDALARTETAELLDRLHLPKRLWNLPPATFSGGEQQRINIARGFISDHPVLLLDEPTASLDAANCAVVVELIAEKKRAGVAMIGVFHDHEMREKIADRVIDVSQFSAREENCG
ncbi:MAG: phosphonate C-P lyase system protein PhnL [Hyphomicrobiales bacterium]|nr:phosphonate C-P lyase system protein PhnL [Hyphomicrobiales bacterium]MDE2115634.1 phosphonate C-P lyase system protein PhnL [Hyphomicrobiales bacterium]